MADRLHRIAYRLRGSWIAMRVSLAGGRCGKRLRVEAGFRLRHGFHAGLALGDDIYLGPNTLIDCPDGSELSIGSRVTMTAGVVIGAAARVEIGDDVMIGEYSSIRTSDHGMALGKPMRTQPLRSRPITISSDVWIGRGCAILASSTLGTGCVVGANSVTSSVVPRLAVVVGAPARIVKRRGFSVVPSVPVDEAGVV